MGSDESKERERREKVGGVLKKKQEIRTPSPRKPQENKIIRFYTLFPYFSLCKISLVYRTVVKTRVLPTRERKKKNGYARTF